MTKILCITLKKVRAASLTRQSEQLSEDPPSPFQDSAVSLAAQRGLETESTHSPSPTPADMKEVTELPAAPQPAGVQPVKRKTSMDSGNTPIEQVLRAAAANPRFSDCPPEHTDKIAESPAQNRSFMQRMMHCHRVPVFLSSIGEEMAAPALPKTLALDELSPKKDMKLQVQTAFPGAVLKDGVDNSRI
ncbi:uncharacterized protein LOC120838609 [Ixodes scapularis]|uniref:uncharacterized protein LOC120838609 n=1 Tax=Ixodes scapularis TaxID=6945 RepID=UPI001C393D20|nr:uncharacterized protein LOC120838609 [Ixodes scapularis]